METINNVANAAAKAVWGDSESKQEPISGVQGNTAQGEPYDAGNMEPEEVKADATTPRALPEDSAKILQEAGNASATGEMGAVNSSHDTEPKYTSSNPGPSDSSTAAQPSDSALAPSSKQAEASEPAAASEPLDNSISKPLDKPSSEHDSAVVGVSAESSKPKAAAKDDDKKDAEDLGTGEKHIKTTGFAAEGGDFDASKPGAGREADRLLEEEGHEAGEGGSGKDHHGGHGSNGGKKSLKERIKAKLHKH